MRFMMIVKADEASESGRLPTEQELAEMGRYNEELAKAGMMLAGEGLHPSSRGARVTFENGRSTITDGPFAETKELVAGFWLIRADSLDQAKEWARRIPFRDGQVEIRQVFEEDDFGEAYTPELREQEQRIRDLTPQ
jgi:hypothetical protein